MFAQSCNFWGTQHVCFAKQMVSMVVPLLGNQHPRFLPRVCLPNFSLVFVRLPSPWTLQLDLTRAGARHTLYPPFFFPHAGENVGVWVEVCSPKVAFVFAAVRNRPQPFAVER